MQGYEETQWSSKTNENGGYDIQQGSYDKFEGYDYPNNYNNFGYDQAYEDYSQRGNNRRDYYDHGERSERGEHGFNEPRKRHVASEPSPHVIFLGLDLDFTEADVRIDTSDSLRRLANQVAHSFKASSKIWASLLRQ